MGCGQKGPLYLPNEPAAQGRATLPQTLDPSRSAPAPVVPAAPASAASTSQ
ncbi:MAG: lipoprotein [Acidovorax sp.]